MDPFVLHDAHLLHIATGRSLVNLRELLTALKDMESEVLRHHMFRFPLDPAYDYSAFGHHLASWAETGLLDSGLAERLGSFDPYADPDPEALRASLLDIIEDHLVTVAHVPWARPGRELYLMRSILVTFPSGRTAASLGEMRDAIAAASRGSIYHHFLEARTRLDTRSDDFSTWIELAIGRRDVAEEIRRIDYPALRIDDLRSRIAAIIGEAE